MIGIAFAVKHEAKELLAALEKKRWEKTPEALLCTGRIGEKQIAVAIVGMGRERAARGSELFLRRFPLRLLILAGYAGALRPDIQRGQIAVASNYLDAGSALWFSGGEVPELRIATTDVVVGDPESRRKLAEETNADLVDMETDAVASVARARGVPFVSLRVVTDGFEDRLPVDAIAAAWESEGGTVRALPLTIYLATHPGEIGPLLRFARFLPEARHRLTRRLLELVYSLGGGGGTSGI
ncbi:5'-methylthioadenosine/S-adenosylhomocysteine nucleosidase [Methylacidimicrobium cyclopophantes]|uniref:5'-methylthioadenosine/S-adenosylhomocysteine nucleosidase n=1 Tax=Methylacidimicrobium cyclopophantes TaxID=1041766 RepID=A0A5E6MHA9_9BACT|nr:nucleoside phosphorylase [Methylacidimicrobium cyclopophantes]VVM08504.1 5'-methylthioadenosine/S-adenosylhomocysteine nucleosidase [Methylacidimicrobium cyclopophantes]